MDDISDIIKKHLKKGNDFGFSSINEDELNHKLESLKHLEKIEALVMPFYANLMNAKGDIIKWPEEKRKVEIEKQIKALLELTRQK